MEGIRLIYFISKITKDCINGEVRMVTKRKAKLNDYGYNLSIWKIEC